MKCINCAWFVFSFDLAGEDGHVLSSGDLPMRRSGTLSPEEGHFQEGAVLRLIVGAAIGTSLEAPEQICFARNGKTAIFEVGGISLDFNIRLAGSVEEAE